MQKFVSPKSRIKSSFYTEFLGECNKISEKYDNAFKKIANDELISEKQVATNFTDLCNSTEKLLVNLEDKFVEEENEIKNNKIDIPCDQFMFPKGDASQAYKFQLDAIKRAKNCFEIIADQKIALEKTENSYSGLDNTYSALFDSSVIIESDKNDDYLDSFIKFINDSPNKVKFTAILVQLRKDMIEWQNCRNMNEVLEYIGPAGITLSSIEKEYEKSNENRRNNEYLKERPDLDRRQCEINQAHYDDASQKFMKHFLVNPQDTVIIKKNINANVIKDISNFIKTKNYEIQITLQLKCGENYTDSGRVNCELLSKELLNAGIKNFVCSDSKISKINEIFFGKHGDLGIKRDIIHALDKECMTDPQSNYYYESKLERQRKKRIKAGIALTFVVMAILTAILVPTVVLPINMGLLAPVMIGILLISFLAFFLPYKKTMDKTYYKKHRFLHNASSDYQKVVAITRLSETYKNIFAESSFKRLQLEENYNKYREKVDAKLSNLKAIYLRCLAETEKYLSFLPKNFDYAIIPVIYKIMSTGEATDFKSACTLAKNEISRNNELEEQRRHNQAVLSSQLKTEEYERQKANAQQEQARFARQQAESARKAEEYAKQQADSAQHTEEYAKQQADSAKKQTETAEELLRRSNDPYYINKWKNS